MSSIAAPHHNLQQLGANRSTSDRPPVSPCSPLQQRFSLSFDNATAGSSGNTSTPVYHACTATHTHAGSCDDVGAPADCLFPVEGACSQEDTPYEASHEGASPITPLRFHAASTSSIRPPPLQITPPSDTVVPARSQDTPAPSVSTRHTPLSSFRLAPAMQQTPTTPARRSDADATATATASASWPPSADEDLFVIEQY